MLFGGTNSLNGWGIRGLINGLEGTDNLKC